MIVCPGSLVKNWEKEFNKWLGRERINVFAVNADKNVAMFKASAVYQVWFWTQGERTLLACGKLLFTNALPRMDISFILLQ